jgi:hypothetical protein
VPLGLPFYYRVMLAIVGLTAAGWAIYRGYMSWGPGWVLLGSPVATAFGLLVQGAILRAFPPKLEAYAEGSTWLKLT